MHIDRKIAIVTPQIGSRSETFIARYCRELFDGQVVVIAGSAWCEADWKLDCPTYIYNGRSESQRQVKTAIFGKILKSKRAKVSSYSGFVVAQCCRHNIKKVFVQYLTETANLGRKLSEAGIEVFGRGHGFDVSNSLVQTKWREKYRSEEEFVSRYITMSNFSKARLVDEVGLSASKIDVVPYGVEIPRDQSRECGASGSRTKCLAVGRMVPKKAPVLLLDAFRRVVDLGVDVELEFIGDGPLLPAVRQLVVSWGLEDRVTLRSGIDSAGVKNAMLKSDLFIQHSVTCLETGDQEGLPLGILEAMSCGLPIVSTRHAGIPEAVSGECGYLVDEFDTAEMASRISQLVRDEALRVSMGLSARSRVKDKFSWDRERRSLEGIFLKMQTDTSGVFLDNEKGSTEEA